MTPVDPRLLRRAVTVRRFVLGCAVIGVLTAGLIVGQAWLLAHAIGTTVDTRRLDGVLALLPWLVVVFTARALLSWAGSVLAQRSAAGVKSQLRTEIAAARLGRPTGTDGSTRPRAASVIMTATTGLDALDGYFARYLPQLALAVVVPVVVGVAIWSVDWVSAVIIAVTLPLIPVFMILVGRLTQVRARRRWRTQIRLAHHFADLVAGLPTLQVLGRAKAQAVGLERSEQAHRLATVATLRIAFLSSLVLELVAMLSVALVAVGVGLRTVDGGLSLTWALFVLLLAPEAYRPLREVGTHYHDAADGLAAADQAFAIIDAAPSPSPSPGDLRKAITSSGRTWGELRKSISSGDRTWGDSRKSISERGRERDDARRSPPPVPPPVVLRRVSVRYDGSDRDALAPTDLAWAPGEVLAVAGPSGSGKSTLVAALLGLVPTRTGTIMIGGVDVAYLDPAAWRSRFAVVPQRPQLITGTVADNVRLGQPAATAAQVAGALHAVGAAELEPDRWLIAADEPLSAGELRRVALARALLRLDLGDGGALVLDEPTAGLDADAEITVIDMVRALGTSVLVITHRPAVLAAADRVIMITTAATQGHEALVGAGA